LFPVSPSRQDESMSETPTSSPPIPGDFKVVDGQVHIYDGEAWVPHERLSDLGPLPIFRGDAGEHDGAAEHDEAGERTK